jgi:type VI secretion system protein ImpH
MAHSTWTTFDAVGSSTRARLVGDNDLLQGGFYAVLRKLECLFREAPRFGESITPSAEPVRLTQDPSLAFRAWAFQPLNSKSAERASLHPQLRTTFFGLYGPHGPLPTHLTQLVADRAQHHGDGALRAFLDIFQHRMITLFYRAWADSQPSVQRDRPQSDNFALRLGALIGCPAAQFDKVDALCLFSATHLSCHTRHAEGLTKLLQASLGVPACVEEFMGQWLTIPEAYTWRVAGSEDAAAMGVLGESTRIGTEVWERQAKFRVVLGPLSLREYEQFLPGGAGGALLAGLVQRYAGPELSWDLRLVLREPERSGVMLAQVGVLGRTSYLAQSDGGTFYFEDLVIDACDLTLEGHRDE